MIRWKLVAHHTDGSLSTSTVFDDGEVASHFNLQPGDHVEPLHALVIAAKSIADNFGPEQVALTVSQREAIESLREAIRVIDPQK